MSGIHEYIHDLITYVRKNKNCNVEDLTELYVIHVVQGQGSLKILYGLVDDEMLL